MTPNGAGRFAPSPSADLHIGNLRTAVLAWLFARSTGRRFLMRVEDLDDRTHADIADRQLDDLAAIGLTWDEPAEWQTASPAALRRTSSHALTARGLLYECYCSRRDIQQAPRAPHAPEGAYPGTCRDLTDAEREARRQDTGPRRRRCGCAPTSAATPSTTCCTATTPGWSTTSWSAAATACPPTTWRSSSTTPPQGIDQVVRGDDLLSSSPRQAYLANLLGHPEPMYAHVALVLNDDGARLAKRDGAVTLAEIGVPTRARADRRVAGVQRDEPERHARRVRPRQAAARPVEYSPTTDRRAGRRRHIRRA